MGGEAGTQACCEGASDLFRVGVSLGHSAEGPSVVDIRYHRLLKFLLWLTVDCRPTHGPGTGRNLTLLLISILYICHCYRS